MSTASVPDATLLALQGLQAADGAKRDSATQLNKAAVAKVKKLEQDYQTLRNSARNIGGPRVANPAITWDLVPIKAPTSTTPGREVQGSNK